MSAAPLAPAPRSYRSYNDAELVDIIGLFTERLTIYRDRVAMPGKARQLPVFGEAKTSIKFSQSDALGNA